MATTEEIVAAVIAALEAQRSSSPGRRDEERKRIDDRHIKFEEFNGNPEEWYDWSFTFKRLIKGKCQKAWELMNAVEKQSREDVQNMTLSEEQNKIGSELYDILCGLSRGTAKENGHEDRGLQRVQSLARV